MTRLSLCSPEEGGEYMSVLSWVWCVTVTRQTEMWVLPRGVGSCLRLLAPWAVIYYVGEWDGMFHMRANTHVLTATAVE